MRAAEGESAGLERHFGPVFTTIERDLGDLDVSKQVAMTTSPYSGTHFLPIRTHPSATLTSSGSSSLAAGSTNRAAPNTMSIVCPGGAIIALARRL